MDDPEIDSAQSIARTRFLTGVGERVTALRGAGRWSQEELAERAGVNVQTLSRLERGVGAVRLDTLAAVASALETTPSGLLAGLAVSAPPSETGLREDPRGRELEQAWPGLAPSERRLLVELATALRKH